MGTRLRRQLIVSLVTFDYRSVAKCRGSWVEVVGRGCGSWVWVWVNVVGKKSIENK